MEHQRTCPWTTIRASARDAPSLLPPSASSPSSLIRNALDAIVRALVTGDRPVERSAKDEQSVNYFRCITNCLSFVKAQPTFFFTIVCGAESAARWREHKVCFLCDAAAVCTSVSWSPALTIGSSSRPGRVLSHSPTRPSVKDGTDGAQGRIICLRTELLDLLLDYDLLAIRVLLGDRMKG